MDQPPMTSRGPAESEPGDASDTRLISVKINPGRLRTSCARGIRRQAGKLALLSQMLKKPRLLRLWLATAWRAQAVLGVSALVLIFGGPALADRLAQKLYPTQFEEPRFFQRLTGKRTAVPNPLRESRPDQFLTAAWAISIGAALLLLVGNVPRAVAIGRQRAAELLARAEDIATVDPAQSAHLRITAAGLVVNDDRSGVLRQTDTAGAPVRDATLAAADSGATVRMSPAAASSSHARTAPEFVGADRRYRLERRMGGGGMGVVHAATDMLLERSVALKQLYPQFVGDREHSMRFRQEAMALAGLTHPHIVTMYDLIEFDLHFWIVMELLPGGSLADRIDADGSIAVADSIAIASDIAGALDYAHRNGVVHRDVKPMNILFTTEGIPKLADFGTAKLRESWIHTSEGEMLGSPAFMSPEQITGAVVGPGTDVYCLGITLYQMLTGSVPFDGELAGILAQHVNRRPDPPSRHNPDIPAGLDEIVLRMLAKAPEDRWPSCRDVADALATLRAGN